MRTSPALVAAAVTVAAAVIASGCASSKGGSGVASLGGSSVQGDPAQTTGTTATRQDFQTAILSYTRCLRAHGIQVADPNFNGGGGGGFFGLRQDRNNPKFQKAQAACRSKLAAIRPQFSPQQQQQFQATALKFAQCMRKNGVNVPDPNFNGGGGGGGGLFGGSGINRNDPKVQKAFQTCQKVFTNSGLGRRGGRGGGFFGGGPPGGAPPGGGSG